MKQSNTKGTAVYLRLASPCRLGIWTQETKVSHYLREVGGNENVEYYRDNGFAGRTAERPALQAMLEQAAKGTIGTVIVTSYDRLARSFILMGELIQFFKAHGIRVIALDNPCEDDSIFELLGVQS